MIYYTYWNIIILSSVHVCKPLSKQATFVYLHTTGVTACTQYMNGYDVGICITALATNLPDLLHIICKLHICQGMSNLNVMFAKECQTGFKVACMFAKAWGWHTVCTVRESYTTVMCVVESCQHGSMAFITCPNMQGYPYASFWLEHSTGCQSWEIFLENQTGVVTWWVSCVRIPVVIPCTLDLCSFKSHPLKYPVRMVLCWEGCNALCMVVIQDCMWKPPPGHACDYLMEMLAETLRGWCS